MKYLPLLLLLVVTAASAKNQHVECLVSGTDPVVVNRFCKDLQYAQELLKVPRPKAAPKAPPPRDSYHAPITR